MALLQPWEVRPLAPEAVSQQPSAAMAVQAEVVAARSRTWVVLVVPVARRSLSGALAAEAVPSRVLVVPAVAAVPARLGRVLLAGAHHPDGLSSRLLPFRG